VALDKKRRKTHESRKEEGWVEEEESGRGRMLTGKYVGPVWLRPSTPVG